MDKLNSKNLSKAVGAMAPVLEKLVGCVQKVMPTIEKYYSLATKFYKDNLAEYHTAELTELCFGFTLLFLGGNFALTLACYTAIRMTGWDTLRSSCLALYESYLVSRQAIEKDLGAELDEDGDGKVDIVELAKAMRKQENINKLTFVLLKALDPQKIIEALKGLWIVLLSVVATLRTQFAQQITIGANIGAVLQESLESFAEPQLIEILESYDKSYAKWSNFIIVCISRVVCISICMMLTRIITAYHSALQGGKIIARTAMKLAVEFELIASYHVDKYKGYEIIFMNVVACYGFYIQLMAGFSIPWFLRMILFPFLFTERILQTIATFRM